MKHLKPGPKSKVILRTSVDGGDKLICLLRTVVLVRKTRRWRGGGREPLGKLCTVCSRGNLAEGNLSPTPPPPFPPPSPPHSFPHSPPFPPYFPPSPPPSPPPSASDQRIIAQTTHLFLERN